MSSGDQKRQLSPRDHQREPKAQDRLATGRGSVSSLKQMQRVQAASGEGCDSVSSGRILKQSIGLYVGYRYIVTFSRVLVDNIFP